MNSNSSKPTLLLVDDVRDNVTLLAGALEADYDIQFALGGRDALRLAEAQVPDLILLDVMMPDMNGLDVLRHLRNSVWGREIPVVLITADDRTDTQTAGLGAGADDFLPKPIILPVLKARIRNVLERHLLLRQKDRLLAELLATNKQLKHVSALNAAILASAGEGIYSVDTHGRCTSMNPVGLRLLGYSEVELLGQDQHAIFHHRKEDGSVYPVAECPIHLTLQDGLTRSVEDAFVGKDNTMIPVHLTVSPIRQDDRVVGAEVIFQDISERLRMQRELVRLANTDALTGILNRRRFFELAEVERTRIQRYGPPAALLMIDLDHFKRINDTCGHQAGDAVLIALTQSVTQILRTPDIFARMGGEEFSILLPETDVDGARLFAARLQRAIDDTAVPCKGTLIHFTASLGLTLLVPEDDSVECALARADSALYAAKAAGRHRMHEQFAA